MPVSAGTLKLLLDAGLRDDGLIAVVAAIDVDMSADNLRKSADSLRTDEQAERRRAKDRARAAEKREEERLRKSADESADKSADDVAAKESLPAPSKKITTHKVLKNARAKHRLPEGWEPKAEVRLRAKREHNKTDREYDFQLERFKNWARSGAKMYADWDATWWNWITNPRYQQNGKHHQPTALRDSYEQAIDVLDAGLARSEGGPSNPVMLPGLRKSSA